MIYNNVNMIAYTQEGRMMKRLIGILLAACMLFGATASASNFYLVEDSNTRRMTREELWGWQYDALGYVFNEIFARHGYHFNAGGKYESYFMAQDWYEENETYATNQEIYHHLMNSVEWYNERLCKEVRAEMRALGTKNERGKGLPPVWYEPEIDGAFSSFEEISIGLGKKLRVYSGPDTSYYRGANGKAMASTNGKVYACGWEDGWLMVMYWTNGGSIRVGFTPAKDVDAYVDLPSLDFEYSDAVITKSVTLTDDPVMTNQKLAKLQKGTQVTFLSEFVNRERWAYVETWVDGKPARGFVRSDCIDVYAQEDE